MKKIVLLCLLATLLSGCFNKANVIAECKVPPRLEPTPLPPIEGEFLWIEWVGRYEEALRNCNADKKAARDFYKDTK